MKNCMGLKILIWMNMPSHLQSAFFRELRNRGVDLIVYYYDEVDLDRVSLGWDSHPVFSEYEYSLKIGHSLNDIGDWQKRLHVVPGYGSKFLRQLVRKLSREGINWIHWSECSHYGLRWYLSYPVKRWYAQMINKCALGALAVGQFAAEDFVRWGIKREKIGLVFYSPESEVPSAGGENENTLFEIVKSQRVFLYVGSLEKRKGIDLLMKAYREAIKYDDKKLWVLVLVGNDNTRGRYTKLAKSLGIEDRILFAGVVPAKNILRFHAIADVLVLPSRFDGWGATVNESCSQGKAVIVSDHCGASMLVDPGRNGFIFKSGDWRSLAYAMGMYISNPDLALIHGKISLKMYERFSPEANAERFCEIVNTMMS